MEHCIFYSVLEVQKNGCSSHTYQTVSIKDKMTYATAKGGLKDKLGHSLFVEEVHTTLKEELTWASHYGNKKPIDARSQQEIIRENVHKQEEDERKQRASVTINSGSSKSFLSGGYHSVQIPLSESAKEVLNRFKSGQINFVQLEIDEKKEFVNVTSEKSISATQLEQEIHTSEPRFYLYVKDSNKVFIYSCPDKSPTKLRMVYSTAKPSVAEQIGKIGITLAGKKVEITTPTELTEELKSGLTVSASATSPRNFTGRLKQTSADTSQLTPLGGTVKSTKVNTVEAHPIYNLIEQKGKLEHGVKKKIVLPPPGAY